MPLVALIAAHDQLESGEALRATLPLAGRTLIEHQVHVIAAAGVAKAILLVERVPPALAQAIDRLRLDGIAVDVARSVADAVDRLHPNDRVLLVADSCLANAASIGRLVQTVPPALLVLPDTAEQAMFERIDPESRWAGYALISGAGLQDTARMLGDWDLISTQLRRSVQEGAARIDALASSPPPVIVTDKASLGVIERALLRPARADDGNWVDRYLNRLIARPLVGPLVLRNVPPLYIALGSVGLAWIGALLSLWGYFWPAVLMLPVATAACVVAQAMAQIWSRKLPYSRPIFAARHGAGLLTLVMLALYLSRIGGWGWWIVVAIAPLGLAGLAALQPISRAMALPPAPRWLPVGDGLIWIAPVLAILAGWSWMAALLSLYCAIGFGWQLFMLRKAAIAN